MRKKPVPQPLPDLDTMCRDAQAAYEQLLAELERQYDPSALLDALCRAEQAACEQLLAHLDAQCQWDAPVPSRKRRRTRSQRPDGGLNTQHTRIQAAAQQTTGETQGSGGFRHGKPNNIKSAICTFESVNERAKKNGIAPRTQIKLDRLARLAPDVLQLVKDGRLSVAAAERAAGLGAP